jgi:hypothetical protein
MQKCKTKHINIYMSFSNRPNLVSKAKNETKITHMNHIIVKALPQVIYENTSDGSNHTPIAKTTRLWINL